MPIVLGNQGLNALAAGIDQGTSNYYKARKEVQDKATDDARYADAVKRANDEAAIRKAQEARRADEYSRQTKNEDQAKAGLAQLAQFRLGQMGGPPTDPNAQGPTQSGDPLSSAINQHTSQVLSHAQEMLKTLPPEFHDRLLGEVQFGLHRDQQNAIIDKLSSDIENLGNDTTTEIGGGPVQDLLGEAGDGQSKKGSGALGRLSEAKAILETIRGSDPTTPQEYQQRQQQIAAVSQAIGATHDQLNREQARRNDVAATVAGLQPRIAADRAHALTLDPNDPLAEILMQRANAKDMALAQYSRDRNMTYSDLQKAMTSANSITLPMPRASTSGGGGSRADAMTRAQAIELANKDPRMAKDAPEQLNQNQRNAIVAEYMMKLGVQDQSPEQSGADQAAWMKEHPMPQEQAAQQSPAQTKPLVKFDAVPKEAQSGAVEALTKAIAEGRREDIPKIIQFFGIDADSIPQAIRSKILGVRDASPNGPAKERRQERIRDGQ